MESKSKDLTVANDRNAKRWLTGRRLTTVILLATLAILFLFAYAVPVISITGCPDSWGCPYGVHGLIHVSITRYFFHFGAESIPLGYSFG